MKRHVTLKRHSGQLIAAIVMVMALNHTERAGAQVGGPGTLYVDNPPVWNTPTGTGLALPFRLSVNGSGQAMGSFNQYENGAFVGSRGIRWAYGSGYAYELLEVDTNPYNGAYYSYAQSLNSAGQVVGSYTLIDTSGTNVGQQAARWDAGSTAPINLGHLTNAVPYSEAIAISDSGIVAGYSYVGPSVSADLGTRAVRWEAGSTSPTELGHLGTNTAGYTHSRAEAVNNSGALAGYAYTWASNGIDHEHRAVRWDAGSTTAVQLALPGSTAVNVFSEALGINDAGMVYGNFIENFSNGQQYHRGIRWDAAGNYTVLESPHPPSNTVYGITQGIGDMNAAGTVVGSSYEYDDNEVNVRSHALMWAPGTGTPTVLNPLSINSEGYHYSYAQTINDAGLVGGSSALFQTGSLYGSLHAVVWMPGGTIVDLNDSPIQSVLGGNGTWFLESVHSIAADGWATGIGYYDEDGAGTAYNLAQTQWVAQLGFGGIVTARGGASAMRWGDGSVWSTGTPALEIGRALFRMEAARQMFLDRIVTTRSVDMESGELSLDVGGQYLTVAERIRIHAGARLNLRTIFDPANDLVGFVHSDIYNEGTLSPGNSPGLLNLNGDLFNTGLLEFEIAGTGAGEFDQLWISGLFDADGSLKLVLDGYAPVLGDEFDLLDWGSVANQGLAFDFSSAALSSGLQWDTGTFWSDGILRISAVPEPSGMLFALIFLSIPVRRRRV